METEIETNYYLEFRVNGITTIHEFMTPLHTLHASHDYDLQQETLLQSLALPEALRHSERVMMRPAWTCKGLEF